MIKFKNVTKSYGDNTVIKDISFTINEGECFVFVGPSGCGKTTTLKMINRLNEISGGDILFNNKNIKEYDLRNLRLDIGYVLQQIALFPNLTVYENISLIPEMKKWNKKERIKKTRELLNMVGLDDKEYFNRYPKDLSGGEQQRVGILRAIIANPKVLLMDEPFSALDPISRSQLQDIVKKLHKEMSMTIVFVTHDMSEALKLGDRICIMKDGKVLQIDSPENIKNNPKNEFVEEFFKMEGCYCDE